MGQVEELAFCEVILFIVLKPFLDRSISECFVQGILKHEMSQNCVYFCLGVFIVNSVAIIPAEVFRIFDKTRNPNKSMLGPILFFKENNQQTFDHQR